MTSNWDKMMAIGSVLSSIAIIIVGVQLFQTEQSIDLQKRSLSDTENEQSQHLRPWLGVSSIELSEVHLNPDNTIKTADEYEKNIGKNPDEAYRLRINYTEYEVDVKNFGSTPAENVGVTFNWINALPKVEDLHPANQTTKNVFMPDDMINYPEDLPFTNSTWALVENNQFYYTVEIEYDFNGGHGYYREIGYVSPTKLMIINETAG